MRKLAIALAIAAVTLHAQAPVSLGVRGRINANVSLAASGEFVAAVWSSADAEDNEDIDAAFSRDGGVTFAPAVRVNSTPGSARTSGEQPPRLALIPRSSGPGIVVVWTAKGTAGTRLMSAKSDDSGRTFTGEAIVPGSDAAGNRGWESVAADAGGHVHVLWLDHRDAAATAMDMSHHMDHNMPVPAQADAVARAQLSKIYAASLDDPRSGHPLAAGVCYCCKTAMAVGADGSLDAAWRHVYPGNIRDIAFARSTDGGRTFSQPVRVSEDKWAIDGCPENGPAMAVGADRVVHLAWPTLVGASGNAQGTLGLFYAATKDGRQFSPRQAIPTSGVPRHVQLLAGKSGLALAWDEAAAGPRQIALARGAVRADGHVDFTRQVLKELGDASYASLAQTPDSLVIAAQSGGDANTVIRLVRVKS
ncbi:MAG TPA: sialidase family protein [Vicinamibacterales bacterium]|jgi:hypothetical protein|nr:sialidase family protein [Vicinamibacterales bacterium]